MTILSKEGVFLYHIFMMGDELFGLVMTGGGARGAYQAGVLKRISELYQGKQSPFRIIAGASAGAINGVLMAAGANDFYTGSAQLARLWGDIETEQVFRTDVTSMGAKAGQWLADLSLGGIIGGGRIGSLLDAAPLKKLLENEVSYEKIQENINSGALHALAIVATNYTSGKSFTFVQGRPNQSLWKKSRREAVSVTMQADHILASSAIPILFQPVKVSTSSGDFYFGDGCLRLTSPLSPAIRLGAKKILAIGVRTKTTKANVDDRKADGDGHKRPPLAQVLGVVLNAIFLDHLDTDVEHLQRMNELIRHAEDRPINMREPMRILDVFSIAPSVDLGALAVKYASKIPVFLRYLLRGFGSKESETSDLMSYLLFTPEYTKALLDIGYHDADQQIDEIKQFLGIG